MYCLAFRLVVIFTAVNFRHLLSGIRVNINQTIALYISVFNLIILILWQRLLIKYTIWWVLLRVMNRLVIHLWWFLIGLLFCQMVWSNLLLGWLLAHYILKILDTMESLSILALFLLELRYLQLSLILMNDGHWLFDLLNRLRLSYRLLNRVLSRLSVTLFNWWRNDVLRLV